MFELPDKEDVLKVTIDKSSAKGDSDPIRTQLNWKPNYTFEHLMDEMIENWLTIYKK